MAKRDKEIIVECPTCGYEYDSMIESSCPWCRERKEIDKSIVDSYSEENDIYSEEHNTT